VPGTQVHHHQPHYRRLRPDELDRVVEIDVTESDDIVLVQDGTSIRDNHQTWSRPPRGLDAWRQHRRDWTATLADGGAAWGAFAGNRLVGLAVLRRRISPPATDQLEALFVDRRMRRQGIASTLIGLLEDEAVTGGASLLVVSATPSRSAVGAYRRAGFAPSVEPLAQLLAREPDDIHLEKEIG